MEGGLFHFGSFGLFVSPVQSIRPIQVMHILQLITYKTYIWVRAFLLIEHIYIIRIIPRIIVAKVTMFSTWEIHHPVLLNNKVIPRCFSLSTKLIGILLKQVVVGSQSH